ncbi:Uncharacterised protein [Bordetella pertussis]|nr:Uncharacterised protein [Bordetella pertussis]CFP64214.1 Uncharacterised protein [Bordetella pertussis]
MRGSQKSRMGSTAAFHLRASWAVASRVAAGTPKKGTKIDPARPKSMSGR